MADADYRIERLAKRHDRESFASGDETLDRYLQRQARQDVDKNVAQCFVLVHQPTSQIGGFYTLSAFSVRASDLPDAIARRLPRYPIVPATLLGRLAVDRHYRGRGLGGVLLLDALRRSRDASQVVTSVAVIADAKSEPARAFYEHYQFQRFCNDAFRLFLPIRTIQSL